MQIVQILSVACNPQRLAHQCHVARDLMMCVAGVQTTSASSLQQGGAATGQEGTATLAISTPAPAASAGLSSRDASIVGGVVGGGGGALCLIMITWYALTARAKVWESCITHHFLVP